MSGDPFEHLDRLLLWSDGSREKELLASLCGLHRNHVRTAVRQMDGLSLQVSALDSLPVHRSDLILDAPRTWLMAVGRPDSSSLRSHLDDSLLADAADTRGVEQLPRSVWSAGGERFWPAGLHPRRVDTAHSFSPSEPYVAPRLPSGVIVDFWSPAARGPLPEVSGESVDPTRTEVSIVLERLNVVDKALPIVSSSLGDAIRTCSKSLVVRKDPDNSGLFTAASTPTALMRPILRNPHRAEATTAEIADGWVHETIHCLFDLAELAAPALGSPLPERELRFRSPWTGRLLDPNTYIQACYVWYGLWHFWSRALLTEQWDRGVCSRMMSRAAWGFLQSQVDAPIRSIANSVSPMVLAGLGRCQASVREEADGVLRLLQTRHE